MLGSESKQFGRQTSIADTVPPKRRWACRHMWMAAWAAVLPMLAPTCMLAAPPFAASPVALQKVVDLELQQGGVLKGQVLSPEGQPVTQGAIKVFRQGELVGAAKVTESGQFRIAGLQPGACQLQLLSSTQGCRLWAHGAAPPKAPRELLLVTGDATARGQQPIGRLLRNPLFLGLVIGAAVAIPIAIHDDSGS